MDLKQILISFPQYLPYAISGSGFWLIIYFMRVWLSIYLSKQPNIQEFNVGWVIKVVNRKNDEGK